MKGFCQHCGKELNGDEPFCPECGMPTGSAQPQPVYYTPPKRNGTAIAIIFVAVIAALCIIGIAFLPMLIQEEKTYTVTITFDEVGITLEDTSQYPPVAKNVYLSLYYKDSTGTHQVEMITLAKDYVYNSGVKKPFEKSVRIEVTGDPANVVYSMYMYVERDYPGGTINDNVDIYKVDTTKITTEIPLYLGCTGVSFDKSDLSEDNSVTFDGDSDPIGHIKMTFSTVTN